MKTKALALLRSSLRAMRGLSPQWLLVVIALILGVTLVASATRGYADASNAAARYAEREGFEAFRRIELDPSAAPSLVRKRAADAIAQRAVTYLGFWKDGALQFELGDRRFAKGARPTPGQLQLMGDRGRMSFPGTIFAHPAEAADGLSTSMRWTVVVEFQPKGHLDAARRALLALVLACGVAFVLTSAAVITFRFGERAQRLRREVEQQKHLAALGTMSAVLAHELRNPLTALKGNAQLLVEDPNAARTASRLQGLLNSVLQLEEVIDDLLEFARLGAISIKNTSPAEVARAAVAATVPERIHLAMDGAPAQWCLDGRRIHQVLVNLIENALHVTPAGEQARVTVSEAGKRLVYTVADRGPGIALADRAAIFEPFFTTRLHGSGLGLAIARRIVELHGGEIDVENGAAGGAVFNVRLPLPATAPDPH